MKRNLEKTLQALKDSGIPATITMLWDGGIDYALISYADIGTEREQWKNVTTFVDLAHGLHFAAVRQSLNTDYFEKSVAAFGAPRTKRDLEQTLQALYDSEINVTITNLGRAGVDFALISYMELDGIKPKDWHHIDGFAELADAVHTAALKEYSKS